MTTVQILRVLGLALVLAVVVTACGGDGDEGDENAAETTVATGASTQTGVQDTPGTGEMVTGLEPVDPLAVTGDIALAGSSTVFPLAEAMAARFEDEGYSGDITIDSIGSGGGFERFCVEGESDISNASRPIRTQEVESCESIGRTPIEFRIGTDALAVTVSPSNTFASDLTFDELALLFSTADTWQDVRADFPPNPIARFIPGTDSGTFDYFVEEIFDEDQGPILGSDPQLSEDDNVLVQGISGDGCDPGDASTTCAVGFFGFAYYSENADALRVLSIEGVEPSAATVNADQYPLARPLFMYSTASIIQEKPQVGDFLAFMLQYVNEEIVEVGYFPAPVEVLQGAADELAAALAG
jgi:phosphate transport system substrate-binding protein